MSTCGGTLYAYSAYANQFKTHLAFTQSQVNLISSIGDNGLYLCSLPQSYILDVFGPAPLSAVSSILAASGYAIMALVYAKILPVSPVLMGEGFFMVGLASSGGYSSALATNVVNFSPDSRGTIVGIIVGGFGLSAFILSQLYSAIWAPSSVSAFFTTLAIALGTIFALGVFLLKRLPYADKDGPPASDEAKAAGDDFASSASVNRPLISPVGSRGGRPAAARSDAESAALLVPHKIVDESESEDADSDSGIYGLRLLQSPEFLLLYGVLTCSLGCGLMYINNLSSVMVSIAAGSLADSTLSSATSLQVGALSIGNCLGRILFGTSADVLVPRLGIPHATFLVGTLALMTAAQALNAFFYLSTATIWIPTILTGLAYGGTFSIGPTCIARFSLAYFATNWAIGSTAAGVGGNAMNTLFGHFYDVQTKAQGRSEKCFGHKCYQTSFFISFALAVTGLILAVILTLRRHRMGGAMTMAKVAH